MLERRLQKFSESCKQLFEGFGCYWGAFEFLIRAMSMRKTLNDGMARFEILGPSDTDLKFYDISAAVSFLRRFKTDPAQMEILSDLVSKSSPGTQRLDPEGVLKQFASMLVSGQVRILRSPHFLGHGSVTEEGAAEKTERDEKKVVAATTQKKRSWIEIYLRDTDGKPVPGQRYRIKLPDGAIEEGSLDDFGHAEYNDINPGTCEVCFPDLDTDEWDRA